MADQFQIPQRNPQYVAPVAPPEGLINGYLDRQQQLKNQLIQLPANAISGLYDVGLQKQQRQIAASEAIAKLLGSAGPYAVNTYGGPLQKMAGITPPTAQNAPSAPTMRPADPSLVGQSPTGSQSPTPAPIPQDPSGRATGWDQPSAQPQPQAASSLDPSATSLQAPDNQPSQAIHASVQLMGHPDYSGHVARIQGLQSQMGKAQQQFGASDWGTKTQKMLSDQIGAENSVMAAEQVPAQARKTQLEIDSAQHAVDRQPTADAIQNQQLVNAQQEIPNKQKATIAGEVSKESESTQRIGQLKTLASNLSSSLDKYQPGLLGNQMGKIYQASGGRLGSAGAAAIQNAANPLATALNTELSRRFSSGEVAMLTNSLIPQPKDTPQYARQKLANLNSLIESMAIGNENNVKNVAAAITSGAIPHIGSSSTPQAATPAIPNGRVTVKSPTGQIGHIPQSQLKAALAAGYTQQ